MRRFRDCVGPKGVPVFRIWQIRVGGTVVFAPYAAQTRRGYVASSPLRAGVRSYGSSERVRMAVVTLPARTCYSTAADGQSGSVLKDTSGKDYRITTILPGDGASENKGGVLKSLHNSPPGGLHSRKPFDAALILASPSLASWLDDPDFVARLLRMTGRDPCVDAGAPVPGGGMSVLSAVVEGVLGGKGRTQGRTEASDGLAVVQGYLDDLLPRLWDREGRQAEGRGVRMGEEGRAGLVFRLPGWARLEGPESLNKRQEMEVTVPVANTVFRNGRTSTMFASRWEGDTWDHLAEKERVDLLKRVVNVPLKDADVVSVQGPLVSITPLRLVQAGLGNILKKLHYEGQDVPASKELEANVPLLLQSRRRMGMTDIQGPLNVWALIVPERSGTDWHFGALKTLPVGELLRSGCRLHRVLSGGGGWGAKQGLLSLDPEARFETTDEEDVERFERDFMAGRKGGTGGGSVVGPGDQVVFCVDTSTYPGAPDATGNDISEAMHMAQSFTVKIRPETTLDEGLDTPPNNVDISAVDDFFGVVAPAMYVASSLAPGGSQEGGVVASMKIDTPGAELSVGNGERAEHKLSSLSDELASESEAPAFEALLQAQESAWARLATGASH